MIVKNLTRSSGGSQLFNYVLDKTKTSDKTTKPLIIRHNVRARSIKGYLREFEENEAQRIYKRSNSTKFHHTILSFHERDRPHLNDKIVKDLVRKYIELRGNNMYVAVQHVNTSSLHVHVIMSGVKDGLSCRISRASFQELKILLNVYQKEKYPQLSYSVPRHRREKEPVIKGDEKNIKKIDRRLSDKTHIASVLAEITPKAKSTEHFISLLKENNLDVYYRNSKLQGILTDSERKFRFSRLDFDLAALAAKDAELLKQKNDMTALKSLRSTTREQGRKVDESSLAPSEDNRQQTANIAAPPTKEEDERAYERDPVQLHLPLDEENEESDESEIEDMRPD